MDGSERCLAEEGLACTRGFPFMDEVYGHFKNRRSIRL